MRGIIGIFDPLDMGLIQVRRGVVDCCLYLHPDSIHEHRPIGAAAG